MLLQTYFPVSNWSEETKLVANRLVTKEEAHEANLLHLSAHLLIIDDKKRILCRHREAKDARYADLWTSSIGTHVINENDYQSTLLEIVPLQKTMTFYGEFMVHDEYEYEVNGLYVLNANLNDLPEDFVSDRKFFSNKELDQLGSEGKCTPHLMAGFELLVQRGLV